MDKIRLYKDRFRIFLILYFFSDTYSNPATPDLKKLFRSEIKIQKIDFYIRNPDYLAYELLNIATHDGSQKNDIKNIIRNIFKHREPVLRRLEMEKFFYGAFEDLDDVICFLDSIGFIKFSSEKASDLKTIEKKYYITEHAINKVQDSLNSLAALQWYVQRCQLIKRFFGELKGTKLKDMQYQIDEYRKTSYKEYIGNIQNLAKKKFKTLYGEDL